MKNQVLRYPFLMATGLSHVESLVVERLMADASSRNESDYDWNPVFRIMYDDLHGNSSPTALIPCHLACASAAPHSYGNLAGLALQYAHSAYKAEREFDVFCKYSIIAIFRAGRLLQETYQRLIGNDFYNRLAFFIGDTLAKNSNWPVWSSDAEGTLSLLDEAMKHYFRPKDLMVANQLVTHEIPAMLSMLEGVLKKLEFRLEITLSWDNIVGPGAEMLRSFLFALLDIERRSPSKVLLLAQALFPKQ